MKQIPQYFEVPLLQENPICFHLYQLFKLKNGGLSEKKNYNIHFYKTIFKKWVFRIFNKSNHPIKIIVFFVIPNSLISVKRLWDFQKIKMSSKIIPKKLYKWNSIFFYNTIFKKWVVWHLIVNCTKSKLYTTFKIWIYVIIVWIFKCNINPGVILVVNFYSITNSATFLA